jgi:2-keto-4-pentenoate hydratase/2-oxohepta-3-ene-1,7-dioic acid hydratase in catechol pathway
MLYERHAIDSTRGYVRRFMPSAYKAAALYERLSGKTFPKFRPKPIWYRQPIYYMSNHQTFVPSGTPIHAPSYTTAFDYELELGFVLAKPLLNPTPEEAVKAIGAFVVLCDFSARDVQRAEMESGFGPQKSKHFLNSMSEIAVTADEILSRVDRLNASVVIDGNVVARTSTAGMQHAIGQVLAHAAKDEQLFPGELFGTGTLPGCSALENGHWLSDGCTLQLIIEGIGEIKHQIVSTGKLNVAT